MKTIIVFMSLLAIPGFLNAQHRAWGFEYCYSLPLIHVEDGTNQWPPLYKKVKIEGGRIFYMRYGEANNRLYYRNGFGFTYLKMNDKLYLNLRSDYEGKYIEDVYLLSWQFQYTLNLKRLQPFLGLSLSLGLSSGFDEGLLGGGINTGMQLYFTDRFSAKMRAEYLRFFEATQFPIYGIGLIYDF